MQKKFEFGVTIVSDLELSQLEDVAAFNHVHVLDLQSFDSHVFRVHQMQILFLDRQKSPRSVGRQSWHYK